MIRFCFSVNGTEDWNDYMNRTRRWIFRLNPMAANVYEFLMMNLEQINRTYLCSDDLCYVKKIFSVINGVYVAKQKNPKFINRMYITAFNVSYTIDIHILGENSALKKFN